MKAAAKRSLSKREAPKGVPANITAARPLNRLQIIKDVTKTPELQIAEAMLGPTASNAAIAQRFASQGGAAESVLGITDAVQVMATAARAVNANDLTGLEAMLTSQAIALNVVFAELARRAALNLGTHMEATETYMRLALKAQAQARATVETLGTLKNPPVVFAKQANFAAGHQQVNNAHTGEPKSLENELGAPCAIGMDLGASRGTSRADSPMATVGKLDRPENDGGQAASKSQRIQGREGGHGPRAEPVRGSAAKGTRRTRASTVRESKR